LADQVAQRWREDPWGELHGISASISGLWCGVNDTGNYR
jgi:hypothetical protein